MRDTEALTKLRLHRPADGPIPRQVPGTDGLQDGLSFFRAKPRPVECDGPGGKMLGAHVPFERNRSRTPETRAQNSAKSPLSPTVVR